MQTKINTIRGHTFFAHCLNRDSVIVDLGANRGEFAEQVSRTFHARCYSVEALPSLFQTLPTLDRVTFFNYAISAKNEPVTFYLSDDPEGASIHQAGNDPTRGKVTIPGRTLEKFLDENGIDRVSLLKLDIEGAEKDLFDSTPDSVLARIDQITCEFHDFCGKITRADVMRIRNRLIGLGFTGIKFSRRNLNWLFVRRDRCGISSPRVAYARLVERNVWLIGGRLRGLFSRENLVPAQRASVESESPASAGAARGKHEGRPGRTCLFACARIRAGTDLELGGEPVAAPRGLDVHAHAVPRRH